MKFETLERRDAPSTVIIHSVNGSPVVSAFAANDATDESMTVLIVVGVGASFPNDGLSGVFDADAPQVDGVFALMGEDQFYPTIDDANSDYIHDSTDINNDGAPDYWEVIDSELIITLSEVLQSTPEYGFADFLALSSEFGQSENVTMDLDLSGTVDFADFLILSANFGDK